MEQQSSKSIAAPSSPANQLSATWRASRRRSATSWLGDGLNESMYSANALSSTARKSPNSGRSSGSDFNYTGIMTCGITSFPRASIACIIASESHDTVLPRGRPLLALPALVSFRLLRLLPRPNSPSKFPPSMPVIHSPPICASIKTPPIAPRFGSSRTQPRDGQGHPSKVAIGQRLHSTRCSRFAGLPSRSTAGKTSSIRLEFGI